MPVEFPQSIVLSGLFDRNDHPFFFFFFSDAANMFSERQLELQ